MKKITSILVASIILLGVTSAAATFVPQKTHILRPQLIQKMVKPQTLNDNSTEGNFTGVFAKKNETGYVTLGELEGTFNQTWSWGGVFNGQWNLSNNTALGEIQGYFFGHLFLGTINESISNTDGWLIGLFDVNETSNQFRAVSIVSLDNNHLIRYAIGTID